MATKEKTVIDDMPVRRVFDSTTDALAFLQMATETYVDFTKYPIAAPGLNESGEFDETIYTADMQPMVSILSQRGEGVGSTTVKAIVVTPVPRLEAILNNEVAKDWLVKIIEKELNHVAVRNLRKADSVADVIDTMPTTLEAYVTSAREGTSGILEAFESLWRKIRDAIATKVPAFKRANLSKKEFRRALESSAYAGQYYVALEDRGEQPSLFVLANQLGAMQAKAAGLDAAIFNKWLAGRDEKVIDVQEDEEDFDLDDLAAGFGVTGEAKPASGNAAFESSVDDDATA